MRSRFRSPRVSAFVVGVAALTCGWGAAVTSSVVVRAQERTTWSGVYSDAQAARGAALFAQHCAGCHGPTAQGGDGPPLTGVEFGGNYDGLGLDKLSDRIRASMPPANPGAVSAQERVDVIAHLLKLGSFPSGADELPRDQGSLGGILFKATKP